ncbi:MAG: 2-oxo acid dehydrogenase subunit E2, partial [Oscillospiraceae bacterium]
LVGDEKDWSSHDTAAKPVSPVPVQTTSAPQEPADDFIPILAQDRSAELSQAAVPVAEHAAAYPDAMPNAKRLAKECGIELSAVKAANGSFIKKCDVEQHLIQTASVEQPDETTKYAVTPMTKMRAAIGRRMLESTSSIPSYAVTVRVNMTGAMLLKEKAAAAFDLKLSYNDILMKAVASAAHSFPLLNARYENDEIRIYPHTDIGLAVGLEGALVVPVVRAAELKSLAEIARSNRENIDKARTGSLTADTIQGASLTISNLGMYGVD